MRPIPELMPSDQEIGANFLRSDFWLEIRDSERFKKKRVMKNAIREYLKHQYAWLRKPEEATELEKYVGRAEFLIRSGWGRKAARTRARNKKRKQKELVRRAKRAIERFVELKSPLLFGSSLPEQKKPRRKVA